MNIIHRHQSKNTVNRFLNDLISSEYWKNVHIDRRLFQEVLDALAVSNYCIVFPTWFKLYRVKACSFKPTRIDEFINCRYAVYQVISWAEAAIREQLIGGNLEKTHNFPPTMIGDVEVRPLLNPEKANGVLFSGLSAIDGIRKLLVSESGLSYSDFLLNFKNKMECWQSYHNELVGDK